MESPLNYTHCYGVNDVMLRSVGRCDQRGLASGNVTGARKIRLTDGNISFQKAREVPQKLMSSHIIIL